LYFSSPGDPHAFSIVLHILRSTPDKVTLVQIQVSAFITAAQMKFLLLHDGKSDDTVKAFFKDVYEVYLRLVLNPFFTPTSRIMSTAFDRKVRALARSYFRG
jgi:hypothetical protein